MSILFAFPGQGAQQPGMLHQLPAAPEVQACLQEASSVLGEDVLALDSAEALQSTRAVQLCLLLAGVSAARLLMASGERPKYVAGLSIGAWGAAVVAGVLPLADAVRLVDLRGRLMQQAWPSGYGMTAILGLPRATLESLLEQVHSAEMPVYLANVNAANQLVIAGSEAAMAEVGRRARELGAGAVRRLAMSVPSHCALLDEPAAQLAAACAKVTFRRPQLGYLSSSSARLLLQPDALRDDLAFNMCRLVDWQSTLRNAWERGVRLHLELPPGNVLTGLARREMPAASVVAFQGTRTDTLHALLREEGSAHR